MKEYIETVEQGERLARVFAANRDRGTIRRMAEDLVLFAELCRDVATASRSNWIVAEEAQKLTHEFLIYLQSTKVPHPFLTGRTMSSSQKERLRRRMIDFLSNALSEEPDPFEIDPAD